MCYLQRRYPGLPTMHFITFIFLRCGYVVQRESLAVYHLISRGHGSWDQVKLFFLFFFFFLPPFAAKFLFICFSSLLGWMKFFVFVFLFCLFVFFFFFSVSPVGEGFFFFFFFKNCHLPPDIRIWLNFLIDSEVFLFCFFLYPSG